VSLGSRLVSRRFADWAEFAHYICHDLASCLTGSMPLGYHDVVFDACEMQQGNMLIDRRCRLRAEVAIPALEIEGG
jgi:hypothetical protein